jgi:hypothetical protein
LPVRIEHEMRSAVPFLVTPSVRNGAAPTAAFADGSEHQQQAMAVTTYSREGDKLREELTRAKECQT